MTPGEVVIAALIAVLLAFEAVTFRSKKAPSSVLASMLRIQDGTREEISEVRNHLALMKGWSVRLDQILERVKENAEKTTEKAAGKIDEVAAVAVERITAVADSKSGTTS